MNASYYVKFAAFPKKKLCLRFNDAQYYLFFFCTSYSGEINHMIYAQITQHINIFSYLIFFFLSFCQIHENLFDLNNTEISSFLSSLLALKSYFFIFVY